MTTPNTTSKTNINPDLIAKAQRLAEHFQQEDASKTVTTDSPAPRSKSVPIAAEEVPKRRSGRPIGLPKAKPETTPEVIAPVTLAPVAEAPPLTVAASAVTEKLSTAKSKGVAATTPHPQIALSDIAVGEDGQLIIFSTMAYGKLHFSGRNRPLVTKHVDELAVKIRKENLLKSFPIIVNSNYEIMDGQHRFMAAQLLNVPIYYEVNDDFRPESMAGINTSSLNWNLNDFLHHHLTDGKSEYQELEKFVVNSSVHLHAAIGLLSGRTAQPNSELIGKFKEGDFVVKDYEGAALVVAMRNDFNQFSKDFWKSRTFLNVISRLKNISEYNHATMIRKVDDNQSLFFKCSTVDQYFDMFSKIYSYKSQKKFNFRELAQQKAELALV